MTFSSPCSLPLSAERVIIFLSLVTHLHTLSIQKHRRVFKLLFCMRETVKICIFLSKKNLSGYSSLHPDEFVDAVFQEDLEDDA